MTTEQYGTAYINGYRRTVRFLLARGLSADLAEETSQAAWAKGWERINQLRESSMILTWMNSIALNLYRSHLRHEPLFQELFEIAIPHKVNLAGIDLRRVLQTCKAKDREVLQRHYLEGYKLQEIAQVLGSTEVAVKVRLLRARRSVGKRLGRDRVAGTLAG